MGSHHLIEPVACTPASGWEKGQVENQVGNLRDQMFRPKPRVKSLAELNAWLEDQCIAYARRTKHPEFKARTIWDAFQDGRASLLALPAPLARFRAPAVTPGALRNGAAVKDWDLPRALTEVRAKLKQHTDGDRQFVKVLGAVLDHGLAAVEAACAEALEAGIASGDVILTVLARRRQPAAPPSIPTPHAPRLTIAPAPDFGRYGNITEIA